MAKKTMRKNIRQIKQELRNFSEEDFATLAEKVRIINNIWFGEENEQDFLDADEIIQTLISLKQPKNPPSEELFGACRQVARVLLYLQGETDKRPNSLAIYEPAEVIASIVDMSKYASKGAVNKKDKFGNTALYYAARGGDLDEVKQLIKDGADVNLASGPYGYTPLMIASKIDVLQALLDAGADINAVGGLDDNTALAQAVIEKDTKKVNFLREHRAKE